MPAFCGLHKCRVENEGFRRKFELGTSYTIKFISIIEGTCLYNTGKFGSDGEKL